MFHQMKNNISLVAQSIVLQRCSLLSLFSPLKQTKFADEQKKRLS